MEKIPTWILVVAGALRRGDGRLLMYCRPEGKAYAGLWEFPGGKVESLETPENALIREIEEELAVHLDRAGLAPAAFAQSEPAGAEPAIVILLYTAQRWEGELEALEGGGWGWFTLAEAKDLPKPPLDVALLAQLTRIWA